MTIKVHKYSATTFICADDEDEPLAICPPSISPIEAIRLCNALAKGLDRDPTSEEAQAMIDGAHESRVGASLVRLALEGKARISIDEGEVKYSLRENAETFLTLLELSLTGDLTRFPIPE